MRKGLSAHLREFRTAGTALCLVTAWALFPAAVEAASYYVDQRHPSASDSNPGTEQLPWKTLYRAEREALQPGDTVFVKPGTYDASSGGSWSEPAINFASSGTASAPITLKAIPRHGATVQANGAAPALGSRDRNYIVIDGFVVTSTSPKGIGVFGISSGNRVKGVVIQNNIVKGIHNSHPTDNTDGVRIENASGTIVRNNKIYDIRNGTMTYNAAGIKHYYTDHTLVEYNEIYSAAACIYDKMAGNDNVFRYNYLHDCSALGIQMHTNAAYPSRNQMIYGNVIARTSTGVKIFQSDTPVQDNIHIYNNTFVDYRDAGVVPAKSSQGKSYIYNNIFQRSGAVGYGEVVTYNDPPTTVGRLDFNLYVDSSKFMLGRYQTNRYFNSLAAWQIATGFDRSSLGGSATFVNAGAGDYRLNPSSIAVASGRSDGTSSGSPVNLGAYRTGRETVGLLPNTALPRAPTLLFVQ